MHKKSLIIIILIIVFGVYVVFEKIALTTYLLLQHRSDFNFPPPDGSTFFKKNSSLSIFCIILTKPDNLRDKALVALYVWVSKCTDYRFVSMTPAHLIKPENQQILKESPFNLLHPKGLKRENYTELTNKVFYAFRDVYEEVGDQYDWYLKADDDTFIYFDHLIKFLSLKNPRFPAIYGQQTRKRLVNESTMINYPVGGPGYILSKAAFNKLGRKLLIEPRFCAKSGIEDLDVTRCLRKMKIFPGKSVDDSHRVIFNPYNFFFYNFTLTKVNLTCCSNSSFVSAHYMSSEDMLRLDLTIKLMNEMYARGKILEPTYEDILRRYTMFGKFLNITEPVEKRHHQK